MNCPECSAEIEEGKKFCTQCGTKIEDLDAKKGNSKGITCPNCSKPLDTGTVFCTSCGTKLDEFGKGEEISCPNCSETLPSGTRFCTGCGSDINSYSEGFSTNVLKEENMDSIKEKSNKAVKGIGGLFSKATSKGGTLDKFTKEVDDAISGKNKDYSKGYLYCRDCGGYYKLQPGESPDDFDSCHCGGELKYVIAIPK